VAEHPCIPGSRQKSRSGKVAFSSSKIHPHLWHSSSSNLHSRIPRSRQKRDSGRMANLFSNIIRESVANLFSNIIRESVANLLPLQKFIRGNIKLLGYAELHDLVFVRYFPLFERFK